MTDESIRLAAFAWLAEQVGLHGEVLPRDILRKGFVVEGVRIPLVSPQGIFKPQAMTDAPLSITTTTSGPYDDSFGPEGLLMYRYRGRDPKHPDNVGLRQAMHRRLPLVYFHGVVPGKYLAVWPVFIIKDDPAGLTFAVAVDDIDYVRVPSTREAATEAADESEPSARRAYITAVTRRRLHQQGFRERVLAAYRTQCACCRLRHRQLLDAAHIIPDAEPEGMPRVSNGIALCKLHHAAFDTFILGITPDYMIVIRTDILNEEDGPMLLHGLQGLNRKRILLPRNERLLPNKRLLEERYQIFSKAM